MKKMIFLLFLSAMLLPSCSGRPTPPGGRPMGATPPAGQPAAATNAPTTTPIPTQTPTEEPTLTPTATPGIGMGSTVALAQDASCRMGPDENYFQVFAYFAEDEVELSGRNEAGDWVLVKESVYDSSSPTCWIPVAAIENPGLIDVNNLDIAAYEALPAPPASITAPNGVCGNSTQPMVVKWSPVVPGTEYKLYRNGKLVADQSDGRYYDPDMPTTHKTTVFTYLVQAVNEYGTAPHTVAVSVTVCGKK